MKKAFACEHRYVVLHVGRDRCRNGVPLVFDGNVSVSSRLTRITSFVITALDSCDGRNTLGLASVCLRSISISGPFLHYDYLL